MKAIEENRASLERHLQGNYPERRRLKISGLHEITRGWETRIFAFSLQYELSGRVRREDLILRTFDGAGAVDQAVKEFNVMKRVADRGVPVPRVDLLLTKDAPLGIPSIVMERVRGEELSRRLQRSSPSEINRHMEAMIRHFVQLHRVPWLEVFPGSDIPGATPDTPLGFVPPDLRQMRLALERYRLKDFDPVLQWLETRAGPETESRLCVLHNDYHPLNIMLKPAGDELVILDWSFAEVGDPRLDLAWSALLFGVMVGESYRERFLKLYQELSGRSLEAFEFFEALKLSARLMTIAVWLDENVQIPVRKITRAAIRNEYKVHVLNVYRRFSEITKLRIPLIESL